VLSLFLRKKSEGIKCVNNEERLPIHYAAVNSSFDVIKFLLKLNSESLTMVTSGQGNGVGCNLLHLACQNKSNIAIAEAIVEYICKLCPAFVHMKYSQSLIPLHVASMISGKLNMGVAKILCNTDESVVRDKFTFTAETSVTSLTTSVTNSQQLPLHLLIRCNPPRMEISDEGDCFRLFLQLYPASAGVKDGRLKTQYDLAVLKGLRVYFKS
jgi:hypothetical protein